MIQPKEDSATHEWRLTNLEKRMESLDQKIWALLLLMIANMGGIIGIILTIVYK